MIYLGTRVESAVLKAERDDAPVHLRRSLQLNVDQHVVLLQDLKNAADDRAARMEELTDEMAHNEELPAEEYMRLHEIGPMPTSLEACIKLRAERMTIWATSRAHTAGSCRVSEMVNLRGAMVDLVEQRPGVARCAS